MLEFSWLLRVLEEKGLVREDDTWGGEKIREAQEQHCGEDEEEKEGRGNRRETSGC